MLKKIKLENYRCYNKHEIEFRDLSIVVGKNNAGKSTLIEALRLISITTKRFKNLIFSSPPKWTGFPLNLKGISPSLKGIDFPIENLFHRYGEPPAVIEAIFGNNYKVELLIGSEKKLFALIWNDKGKVVSNKSVAKKAELPELNILPQISPIQAEEKILDEDYIKSNLSSKLASHHFRNQLQYLYKYYKKFKDLSESTWDGLRIREFQKGNRFSEQIPVLIVQENGFAAEIGWMGHGLQMWLQTMWFLARCDSKTCIVLDEPDVYMHADLQRKLIRILKNRFKQVIISTHSTEIISEVEPENVIVIDRRKPKSIFASNFPAVQKILHNIGSIHNIELSRLWSAKKLLIVEGKDISILKRMQDNICEDSAEPFDIIPNMPIGGWNGWDYAIGSKILLRNAGDDSIIIYCIFDSDYHSKEEKFKRYKKAKDYGINLHIWKKKEIENYLLVPSAIFRIIKNHTKSNEPIDIQIVEEKLNEIAEALKTETIGKIADEISKSNRNKATSTIYKEAEAELEKVWEDKLSIISGKKILKRIKDWATNQYCVSFSLNTLAKEIKIDELDDEIKEIVRKIDQGLPFQN